MKINIFKSLTKLAEQDLRDTYYNNNVFKKNRKSTLRRALTILNSQPIKFTILLGLLSILTAASIQKFSLFKKMLIELEASKLSISDFNISLMSIQGTLIALIFPLVIAFIGFLLQGKSSNKAIWKVYKEYSIFPLVGFSSLGLIFFNALTYPLSIWYQDINLHVLNLTYIAWFLLNLVLISYFLIKTMNFLSEKERMATIINYTLNHTLPNDIKQSLSNNHLDCWIHKNKMTLKHHSKRKVNTYKNKKDIKILDIQTFFLDVIIHIASKKNSVEDEFFLELPVIIGKKIESNILVYNHNLDNANTFTRILLYLAIKKTNIIKNDNLESEEVASAIYAQIEDAIKEDNNSVFNRSLDDLIGYIKTIESACAFIDDKSTRSNLLLLPSNSKSYTSFFSLLLTEGYEISSILSGKIAVNSMPFRKWCYFHVNLYNSNVAPAIAIDYIHGHSITWIKLLEVIGKKNPSQNNTSKEYDDAITYFIGSWESWGYKLTYDKNLPEDNKNSYMIEHIERTCHMIIYSISQNNINATKWSVDSLINAWDMFIRHEYHVLTLPYHHAFITPSTDIDSMGEYKHVFSRNHPINNTEIKTLSLINHWINIKFIIIAQVLSLRTCINHEIDKFTIEALLKNNKLQPSANLDLYMPEITEAKDIIDIFFRMNLNQYNNEEYVSRMEKIVRRTSLTDESEYIQGRTYLLNGDYYHQTINRAFYILGVALSRETYTLNNEWKTLLHYISNNELRTILYRLKSITLDEPDINVIITKYFDLDPEEIKDRKEKFHQCIENITSDINKVLESR